jgi:hypothetical protein
VDVWTAQHDAKFLDLLLLRSMRGCAGVGDLTADDRSAIRAKLNVATGSAFPVEDLQRRLAELRRAPSAGSRTTHGSPMTRVAGSSSPRRPSGSGTCGSLLGVSSG